MEKPFIRTCPKLLHCYGHYVYYWLFYCSQRRWNPHWLVLLVFMCVETTWGILLWSVMRSSKHQEGRPPETAPSPAPKSLFQRPPKQTSNRFYLLLKKDLLVEDAQCLYSCCLSLSLIRLQHFENSGYSDIAAAITNMVEYVSKSIPFFI